MPTALSRAAVALFCLLFVSIAHAQASHAGDLSLRSNPWPLLRWNAPRDCNNNGIPDEVDGEQGTLDDINHNGVPDPCDPDTAVVSLVERRWKFFAVRSDTVYLGVLYHHMAQVVEIDYTVPVGRHRVRLVVTDRDSGTFTVLVAKDQLTGAYVVPWGTSFTGRELPRGRAEFALVVDDKPTYKRVAWDWTRTFP